MANKKIPSVEFSTDLIITHYGLGPNYRDVIRVLETIVDLGKSERSIKNALLAAQQDVPSGWTHLNIASAISILGNDTLCRTIVKQGSEITPQMISATLVLAQAICWTHS